MEQSRVKIKIAGADFSIVSDEDPSYVQSLGEQLDADMKSLFKADRRLSTTQGAVLVALEYADKANKAAKAVDALRSQIKDYLNDASAAKEKADLARREAEESRRETENLKARNSSLQQQLNEILKNIQGN